MASLKCVCGCNHSGQRNSAARKKHVRDKRPRRSQIGKWESKLQFCGMNHMRA